MTSTTVSVPEREVTASRLLTTSSKHSFDPDADIDWSVPIDTGQYFAPPHRISLYGTHLWDQLSEQQRIDLSRHELASATSVGLWTEKILMQMFLRHLSTVDPLSAHHRYGLTEIADECRHSMMFTRLISTLDCPWYGPGRVMAQLGKVFAQISNWPLTLAGVLFVEEFTDTLQREVMSDESLHPLAREVARIHVIEEARHVKYARDDFAREFADLGRAERAWTRLLLARTAYLTTEALIHPRVYKAVGLDPYEARKVARANPHTVETRRWAASRTLALFEEHDLIAGPNKRLYRKALLID